MAVGRHRFYYFREYRGSKSPRRCECDDFDRLEYLLLHWHSLHWIERAKGRWFIHALVRSLAFNGRVHDLVSAKSPVIRLFAGLYATGHMVDGWVALADLHLSDFARGRVVYRLSGYHIAVEVPERDKPYFEGLLAGDAVIRAGEIAGSVEICRLLTFDQKLRFSDDQIAALAGELVAIGVNRVTGEQVTINIATMFHHLICGMTRWGKSVLLHCILSTLLTKPKKLVQKIYCCDLKGGVSLSKYSENFPDRVVGVHDVEGVMVTVKELVALLHTRLAIMRLKGWDPWPGPRVFFVCDEFAILEQWQPRRDDKEGQAAKAEMMNGLLELSQQGAGAGIVLIVAIQKPTQAGISIDFRGNFESIAQFRTLTKNTASQVLGSTDDLLLDPTRQLGRGDCLYRTPTADGDQYLRVYWTRAAEGVPIDIDDDVDFDAMLDGFADVADAA
jgi:hypothetical protein